MSETEIRIEIKGSAYIIKATEVVDTPPPPPPPPPDLPDPGTAFTIVQANTVIEPHDLYVCNPTISQAKFDELNPDSIPLAYTAVTIMPRYGAANPYFNGLRAVAKEAEYWHTASPPSIGNRLVHPGYPTQLWLVRPSPALATRIATYNVGALNPLFRGTMCDESQLVAPKKYVDAWRTAVEWVEADLSKYQMDWAAAIQAQFATYKAAWGSGRAVIANSAGTPYAGIDGFTIEAAHITALGANGLDWAKTQGLVQKAAWEASSAKFGERPILVTWNYPDKIPEFYLGTSV